MFADTDRQLRKLSIRKMQFQVTQIEFDFTDSLGEIPLDEQSTIIENTLGSWEAIDEDDLIEEITCAAGWCIKSIDYHHILK